MQAPRSLPPRPREDGRGGGDNLPDKSGQAPAPWFALRLRRLGGAGGRGKGASPLQRGEKTGPCRDGGPEGGSGTPCRACVPDCLAVARPVGPSPRRPNAVSARAEKRCTRKNFKMILLVFMDCDVPLTLRPGRFRAVARECRKRESLPTAVGFPFSSARGGVFCAEGGDCRMFFCSCGRKSDAGTAFFRGLFLVASVESGKFWGEKTE